MAEVSTGPRSEHPPLTMHDKPADKRYWHQLGAVSDVGMTQKKEKMPQASTPDWRNTRDLIVNILDDLNLPMVGVVITKGKTLRG
ncbi:uncharacterized protein N7479_010111 [Penicillium vulpinum]|uniref:uncharacterized protein n=1 Tax=Penicillium vulpinum TaxID=29845 RepID=UPI002548B457|nr:uncharacterized protein N7479_010111 [Penicillium vulpinum]KAJ5951698.1 hypothetical protein N7479_010111 [Penicillium vulpinum]